MKQINVTFILRGNLMWYPDEKKKVYDIAINKNLRIIDVIDKLKIPAEQINLVLKNGQKANVNTLMNEGDQIEIIPIIVGG